MKLKTKINITIISILIIVFAILGYVIFLSQKKTIFKEIDERMLSQLEDFYTILDDHVYLKQINVNTSMKLASTIFYSYGKLKETDKYITVTGVNQITKQESKYEIPVWTLNDIPLYNTFELVDLIKENTIETATIFQKIDDGYLRISTNVRTIDGLRAVNTYIPNSSEVIKTVEKGETYFGRAFVVNDWYLTAYEPIIINGEVKGILYVGIKERDDVFLKKIYSSKTYYTNGYPFLVKKTGEIIYHRDSTVKTVSYSNFFQKLINADTTTNKITYLWPENELGKKQDTYFKYFKPYESYICVSVYEEDVYAIIYNLLLLVAGSVIIAIFLVFFGITRLINPILNKITESSEFAQSVAKGDFSVKINYTQKDEIGILVDALQNMQKDLKIMVTDLNEKNEELRQQQEEILTQNNYLEEANNEIKSQNDKLETAHRSITDSIQYAQRIQMAMLPQQELLNQLLAEHFILFKPCNIVSGDFYFVKQFRDSVLIAVADCTGHGVPGAFMSMLGIALLNEILRKSIIKTSADVLNELRFEIKNALHQTGKKGEPQDGMDISVCIIDFTKKTLMYAGAHNSLYIVSENKLNEYKADRMPIGVHPKDHVPFTNNEIQLKSDDILYIFSDGFVSQFGGEKNEKFKNQRFKELLLNEQEKNMEQQHNILETAINSWRGKRSQTDDILVVGIKIK